MKKVLDVFRLKNSVPIILMTCGSLTLFSCVDENDQNFDSNVVITLQDDISGSSIVRKPDGSFLFQSSEDVDSIPVSVFIEDMQGLKHINVTDADGNQVLYKPLGGELTAKIELLMLKNINDNSFFEFSVVDKVNDEVETVLSVEEGDNSPYIKPEATININGLMQDSIINHMEHQGPFEPPVFEVDVTQGDENDVNIVLGGRLVDEGYITGYERLPNGKYKLNVDLNKDYVVYMPDNEDFWGLDIMVVDESQPDGNRIIAQKGFDVRIPYSVKDGIETVPHNLPGSAYTSTNVNDSYAHIRREYSNNTVTLADTIINYSGKNYPQVFDDFDQIANTTWASNMRNLLANAYALVEPSGPYELIEYGFGTGVNSGLYIKDKATSATLADIPYSYIADIHGYLESKTNNFNGQGFGAVNSAEIAKALAPELVNIYMNQTYPNPFTIKDYVYATDQVVGLFNANKL